MLLCEYMHLLCLSVSVNYIHTQLKLKEKQKEKPHLHGMLNVSDHSYTSFWAPLSQLDSQAHIVNFKALILSGCLPIVCGPTPRNICAIWVEIQSL